MSYSISFFCFFLVLETKRERMVSQPLPIAYSLQPIVYRWIRREEWNDSPCVFQACYRRIGNSISHSVIFVVGAGDSTAPAVLIPFYKRRIARNSHLPDIQIKFVFYSNLSTLILLTDLIAILIRRHDSWKSFNSCTAYLCTRKILTLLTCLNHNIYPKT